MTGSTKPGGFPTGVVAVLALLAIAVYLFSGLWPSSESAPTADDGTGLVESTSDSTLLDIDPATAFSDLATITPDRLPPEAIDTLDLIAGSGPFPFDRDDTVFHNREGILPDRFDGYYREYTVITPGEDDRGARRIVAGEGGDLYYTADHYQSFHEILGYSR